MKRIVTNAMALLASRRELMTEAGKYFVVGGVCTVLDFGLLYVLTKFFNVHYTTSSIISFMAGTLLNYYLCTYWIFSVRSVANRNLEMVYYVIITAVGLGINYVLIWLLTPKLNNNFMLAKLMATFVTYWWNFGARKYFLHTKPTLQPE